jgi:RNA-directed DNA polymerase
MSTKLDRIAEIAKQKPEEKFTSLIHLIDEEMLKQCHEELSGNKASGVDGVTKLQYEKNLSENIRNLLDRMKRQQYRPRPVKRIYIPKAGTDKMRPLGIPSYEDKIVQLALSKILNAIYEADFIDCSFGFRPQRGCHDALKILDVYLSRRNINYVVDADISGFFDHVDHKWLMKFVEHRIVDNNILRLIGKFLKAGIMENGAFRKVYEGTPQGSLCKA